jgi:hypothetical protein
MVDPITIGLVAGGITIVSSLFAFFRRHWRQSDGVKIPPQQASNSQSTSSASQAGPEKPAERLAPAPVEVKTIQAAGRRHGVMDALRRTYEATVQAFKDAAKKARTWLYGAWCFVKAATKRFFGGPEKQPVFRTLYLVGTDRPAHVKPFLKNTPRIRDSIPADRAA